MDISTDLIAKAEEFIDCKINSMDMTFRGLCRNCEFLHNGTFVFEETKVDENLIATVS